MVMANHFHEITAYSYVLVKCLYHKLTSTVIQSLYLMPWHQTVVTHADMKCFSNN